MEANANLTNKLLDNLEDLLIENRAYATAFDLLEQVVPKAAVERLRAHVEAMKSNPEVRKAVRDGFAPFRDQGIADTLAALLQKLPRMKDVN